MLLYCVICVVLSAQVSTSSSVPPKASDLSLDCRFVMPNRSRCVDVAPTNASQPNFTCILKASSKSVPCSGELLRTQGLSGDRCVFPFIFEKKMYAKCAPPVTWLRKTHYWCSHVKNFTDGQLWSYCGSSQHSNMTLNNTSRSRYNPFQKIFTTYGCRNRDIRLQCSGSRMLTVMNVNYDNFSSTLCVNQSSLNAESGSNKNCNTTYNKSLFLDVVKKQCDNQSTCVINACFVDVHKYFVVQYICTIKRNCPHLVTAAHKGDSETVEHLLVKEQCDVNSRSLDRWRTAVNSDQRTSFTVAEILLLHGADLLIADKWYEIPLHWAVRSGSWDRVEKYLHNCDPNITWWQLNSQGSIKQFKGQASMWTISPDSKLRLDKKLDMSVLRMRQLDTGKLEISYSWTSWSNAPCVDGVQFRDRTCKLLNRKSNLVLFRRTIKHSQKCGASPHRHISTSSPHIDPGADDDKSDAAAFLACLYIIVGLIALFPTCWGLVCTIFGIAWIAKYLFSFIRRWYIFVRSGAARTMIAATRFSAIVALHTPRDELPNSNVQSDEQMSGTLLPAENEQRVTTISYTEQVAALWRAARRQNYR